MHMLDTQYIVHNNHYNVYLHAHLYALTPSLKSEGID
jgi:hypothetical protein